MNTHSLLPVSRALRALTVVFVCLLASTPASAKRGAPKAVAPVVVESVEFSAPHEQMGFVVATDLSSRKELWRVRVYTVRIDPELERDVQDVFITSLTHERGVLDITNESGDSYTLDLATRKVARKKGAGAA